MPVILGRGGCAWAESRGDRANHAASRPKTKQIVRSRRGGQAGHEQSLPPMLGIARPCGSDFCNFAHALAETRFKALVGRVIPGAASKVVGQALHIRDLFLVVVRILVVLAVAQIFHEPGRSIARCRGTGSASVLSTSSRTSPKAR